MRSPDTSRRWPKIEALFLEAAELPHEAREAFLAGIADEELRHEVRSLLAHQAPDGTFIETAIGKVAGQWVATSEVAAAGTTVIGRRFGAYELTGVLGKGGMGAVYRARRADGQFEQDAAIKLVRHGFETAAALERFRQERQILARLTHPSIARLLDGGTAVDESGAEMPYLVMEYVDGEPITAYCARRAMPVADRVRLFRVVCDAVQYAHQQFVVHRDLKPPNILVTASGQPKLLDFGIAKLLTDDEYDAAARTSTGMQLLTPDYASPEQVAGERVTAASDTYSLGALLYELLTGQKAHRFRTLSPVEIGRIVCNTEPVRPSLAVPDETPNAAKLRRQLEGDLDTIVLKALQKQPGRRYQSVEQFSEDLRRHLEGLPVLARPDTLPYRAAKFATRNRWPLAGAAVVAASLVAGTVVSVWQARRAERRFEQVRTLANSLIYDLHDEIRDLPGSTKARQKLVATALDYLHRLERDAGGDPRLRRDLAAAYVRIGDVQGGVLASNLGDVKGALESYRTARGLFNRDPGSTRAREVANVDVKIGDALSYHGDLAGALAAYGEAQSIIEPVARAAGASVDDLRQLATVFESMARVHGLGRENRKSLESSMKLLAIRRALFDKEPANRDAMNDLAESEAEISMALMRSGQPRDALPYAQQSLKRHEQLAQEQPNNVAAQRGLMLSYSHVADLLGNPTMPSLGDAAGAIALYRKMTAVGERLVAADPSDQRAKWDLANCLLRLGSALIESTRRLDGISTLERSAALMRDIAAAEPANNRVRTTQAFVRLRVGNALTDDGHAIDAVEQYREAIQIAEAVLAADHAEAGIVRTLSMAYSGRGLALARVGQYEEALRAGRRSVELSEQERRQQPGDPRTLVAVADADAAMGRIYVARRTPRDRIEGCKWFEKSLQAYRQAQQSSRLDAVTTAHMQAVASDAAASCR